MNEWLIAVLVLLVALVQRAGGRVIFRADERARLVAGRRI
jgi:hypothetical protein